jgi:hypothetical protein
LRKKIIEPVHQPACAQGGARDDRRPSLELSDIVRLFGDFPAAWSQPLSPERSLLACRRPPASCTSSLCPSPSAPPRARLFPHSNWLTPRCCRAPAPSNWTIPKLREHADVSPRLRAQFRNRLLAMLTSLANGLRAKRRLEHPDSERRGAANALARGLPAPSA